ncbi:putative DNA-binding pseudobarrel domain superfamily [Helianthus anomalus]
MFIFNCSKNADLGLPPELYVAVKQEDEEEVIIISDTEDVDEVINGTEANTFPVTTNDETIPVVFRCLKIVDVDGNVWDVRVGIESPDGRFYIKNMKKFVKDKKMVPREEFTLKFVMGKGIFLFD